MHVGFPASATVHCEMPADNILQARSGACMHASRVQVKCTQHSAAHSQAAAAQHTPSTTRLTLRTERQLHALPRCTAKLLLSSNHCDFGSLTAAGQPLASPHPPCCWHSDHCRAPPLVATQPLCFCA